MERGEQARPRSRPLHCGPIPAALRGLIASRQPPCPPPPPAHPHRLGLAITVPLAVAVYDLIVFGQLPVSNRLSFVSALGVIGFLYSMLALLENALVIQLYWYRWAGVLDCGWGGWRACASSIGLGAVCSSPSSTPCPPPCPSAPLPLQGERLFPRIQHLLHNVACIQGAARLGGGPAGGEDVPRMHLQCLPVAGRLGRSGSPPPHPARGRSRAPVCPLPQHTHLPCASTRASATAKVIDQLRNDLCQ